MGLFSSSSPNSCSHFLWRAWAAPRSCWDRCQSPWCGRGYGKWQRDLSTWSPRSLWNKKQLSKWLHEIPFAFWLSALPPMVSGLSLRLGFTQTFVCTRSVATLTTAANNPCFIFTFEGHYKNFVRVLSESWLGLSGSCFLNSFLPRTEQCKMTRQRQKGRGSGSIPGFSRCSPLLSVKWLSGNHLSDHDNHFYFSQSSF